MKFPETAKRLSSELELQGMSQQTLADRSGVSKASISQYVNGTHMPSVASAKKMARVLGVEYIWLLGHSKYKNMLNVFTGTLSLEDFMVKTDSEPSELMVNVDKAQGEKIFNIYRKLNSSYRDKLTEYAEMLMLMQDTNNGGNEP